MMRAAFSSPATRVAWGLLSWHAIAACGFAFAGEADFEPVRIPDWVHGVTRMVFLTPGEIEMAEKVRAQVVHTNVVWPYYPLRRDHGGLPAEDAKRLGAFVEDCHRRGMKVVLGLPPFMPVNLAAAHPEWRVHPDDSGAVLRVKPLENDLGTRSGCNVGPWGDYLIEVLAELLADYRLDGYSFDGNYHPPICFCPACKAAYRKDCGLELPKKADLDDLAYRSYLVWRGERLEEHYRRMQKRLKGIDPNAVATCSPRLGPCRRGSTCSSTCRCRNGGSTKRTSAPAWPRHSGWRTCTGSSADGRRPPSPT
jgi:hypothetical protein